jgi:tRNA(Ile)-lysidine synthase
MLLTKVRETIRKHSMLNRGDRVIVSVSGGPDSVCLLRVLHSLTQELGLSLHVAHLDHCFRGEESAAEASFVAHLARELGIPATIETFDVPTFCRERGLSPQEGARMVRYRFLQQVARDAEAVRIATGHTADDQAETFLMRLVRGAGTSGLSAIPPVRDAIIRPLIDATREEVLKHLQEVHQEFKTDPTNTRPVYTRNRIRLEVLPVLKRFNPRIVETLAREAALLRDEHEAVEAYLAALLENASRQQDDTFSVKRDAFDTLPPAFRRRLLRKLAEAAGAEPAALSRGQVDEALSFMLAAQTGRTMHLPQGITITREYDRFVLSAEPAPAEFSHPLAIPGAFRVPELGLEIETSLVSSPAGGPEDGIYLWQAMFDYDKMGPSLVLRNRRPGDWFCPAGMGGRHKKLQDYFVDEKVPRRKRGTVPLLCSGEDILWVVGLRTDNRFLPGPDTKKALIITIKSNEHGAR